MSTGIRSVWIGKYWKAFLSTTSSAQTENRWIHGAFVVVRSLGEGVISSWHSSSVSEMLCFRWDDLLIFVGTILAPGVCTYMDLCTRPLQWLLCAFSCILPFPIVQMVEGVAFRLRFVCQLEIGHLGYLGFEGLSSNHILCANRESVNSWGLLGPCFVRWGGDFHLTWFICIWICVVSLRLLYVCYFCPWCVYVHGLSCTCLPQWLLYAFLCLFLVFWPVIWFLYSYSYF